MSTSATSSSTSLNGSNTVGGTIATSASATTGATSSDDSGGSSTTGTTGSSGGSGSGAVPGVGGMGGANTIGTESDSTDGGSTGGMTPSSGCGAIPPEGGTFNIDVDGMAREYILRVPDSYDADRAYPLIFAWHPWGGSAQQVAGNGGGGYHGLASVAGDQAILVAGEGIDFGGNGLGWENPNGRDENFMRAMLERFNSELCVDTSRVFSTGFSFGGMMSFALGCGAADVIRAVAPQAGNTSVAGCGDSDLPVAMMGFHGTEDSVVAIDGGRTGRDRIRERNGCSESTTTVEGGWCDIAGDNYQPCTCVSYDGCMQGYPVIWCEFTGPHTPAPNAGQTLWDFFSQF